MKEKINAFDYAKEIVSEIPRGVLLTTMVDEKVNSMTIGWGSLGFEWGKPVFTAYIREGRFTKKQLDANPEFTVNVPLNHDDAVKILKYCGSHSGRNANKVKEAGLTLETPTTISVPGVKEAPLTLECKVIYTQMQDYTLGTSPAIAKFYPQNVPSEATGANKDNHLMVMGEILDAYILK